ncbi:MAG: tRNA (N6-threonylcarbamoyladenosine(37)-N6)-methyltransferase TrmO [Clostridia bacterium]|nr:tRNA (N6-threonylcarbamoyladenosine(37)-N6)-methyltransferase TrmO [Clostridia bacterium]
MRELTPIARIRSDFPGKFGIPRQSGLIDALKAEVVFEPPFRDVNALKGLEGYSHIWLIWQFSESVLEGWSPTVKPPRLGGNRRMGVFATRSPFRPNPLGLSCVRLEGIDPSTPEGPVLHVAGADLMDSTPIYDIKPYLPHADCHPEATGGFSGEVLDYAVEVDFPEPLLQVLPPDKRAAAVAVLRQDPRPGYRHGDSDRRYGVPFAGFDLRFTVEGGVLRVCEVVPLDDKGEKS